MEMEGRDDNSSKPVACQSGKISVFLGHIFYFLRKDPLYKLHAFLVETQFLHCSFYLCLRSIPLSVIKE